MSLTIDKETLLRPNVLWGLDFSCRAASIGWTSGDIRGVVTASWDGDLRGGERLSAAYREVRSTARELALIHPAMFVYVEQPRAVGSSMELTYMCGVLQMAVHDALFDQWDKHVDIRTVAPSKWKKQVLGRGDYKKPKKHDDFIYQGILWCQENGVEVTDHDQADAVAIAEYARQVVRFI